MANCFSLLLIKLTLLNISCAKIPFQHSMGNERRQELQVMQHLLQAGYTSYTRPITDDNDTALEVRIRVSIIKIQNLWERTDQKTEALETTMRIQLNWCDQMLAWEPGQFGGVGSVIIPGNQLWIPDLQIINALDDVYTLTRDRRFDFKLHADGCVWWYPTGTTFTRCELDLSYFPFDVQTCPVIFESAMYPKEFLNLTMRKDKSPVSLKSFTENGQWEMLSARAIANLNYVTSSTAFSRVEVIMELGRKTLYYQLNVICPCGMLSALQILTFLLPIGSEDRISQATTVLLSFVVFQSIAVAELPRTSVSVPLLCVYIDFLTGVSVLTVTNAIMSVYLLKTSEQARFFRRTSIVYQMKNRLTNAFSCVRKPKEPQTLELQSPMSYQVPDPDNRNNNGTFVKENDNIDADSLDGTLETSLPKSITPYSLLGNGSVEKTGNRKSADKAVQSPEHETSSSYPLHGNYNRGIRPVLLETDIQTSKDRYRAGKRQKRWQTITVYIDNFVFAVALISSIVVPVYMFAILPPDRAPLRAKL